MIIIDELFFFLSLFSNSARLFNYFIFIMGLLLCN